MSVSLTGGFETSPFWREVRRLVAEELNSNRIRWTVTLRPKTAAEERRPPSNPEDNSEEEALVAFDRRRQAFDFAFTLSYEAEADPEDTADCIVDLADQHASSDFPNDEEGGQAGTTCGPQGL